MLWVAVAAKQIELIRFMRRAGELAQQRGLKLYLVGGVVRDLLLGRRNYDLDLVVDRDAIALAGELARRKQGKMIIHQRFGTAKITWNGWSADIAAARSETYARACALPSVNPSTIEEDLFRRDFTINAMAVELNSDRYGRVLDCYGGMADLEGKLIRVLHEKSFRDDATRIWRAIRYEQRLDFKLEQETLWLLKRDVDYLKRLSGDRVRHQLELILEEKYPEKALRRADELGVLERLHPGLKANGWLVEKYGQARQYSSPGLYLALLVYRMKSDEVEEFISYLRLRKKMAKALRDAVDLKINLEHFASLQTPSQVYMLLIDYLIEAVTTSIIAGEVPEAITRLNEFVNKLRFTKPALSGEDLKRLGVAQGPEIKAILRRLLEAKLDGRAATKREEEALVGSWLTRKDSP